MKISEKEETFCAQNKPLALDKVQTGRESDADPEHITKIMLSLISWLDSCIHRSIS